MKSTTTLLLYLTLGAGALVARENPNDKPVAYRNNQSAKTNSPQGVCWIAQDAGFAGAAQRGIASISPVSSTVVWASAYDGDQPSRNVMEFTRTSDGGNTWTSGVILADTSTYTLSNIFGMDANTCYATLAPKTGTGGKTLKTTDGGLNWTEVTATNWTGSWADIVAFFDANNGIAVGDPITNKIIVYTTSDAGATWTQTPVANIPAILSGEYPVRGYFDIIGNTIWVGTNKGRVFKSTDKGINWTVSSTGLTTYTDVSFKDANNGFAIQKDVTYALKATTDGGATWSSITPAGAFLKNDFDFLPGSGSAWVNVSAGAPKGSSISYNDCLNFSDIDTGTTQYTTVRFFDGLSGWAGGFCVNGTGGMYKWNPIGLTGLNQLKPALANVSLSPNPSNGIVNIHLEGWNESKLLIEVFDISGKKVLSKETDSQSGNVVLNMQNQVAGMYFVRVSTGTHFITKKVSIVD